MKTEVVFMTEMFDHGFVRKVVFVLTAVGSHFISVELFCFYIFFLSSFIITGGIGKA